MAIQRDKKWHGFLLQGSTEALPPSTPAESRNIPKGLTWASLYYLPLEWYPLNNQNQIELNWYLITMPTTATYVQITPVFFECFGSMGATTGMPKLPGYPSAGSWFINSFAKMSWDDFDSANNRVTVKNYKLYKSAADPILTFATIATTVWTGTRHAIPTNQGYIAFYCEHDGTVNTGLQTLSATVTWS